MSADDLATLDTLIDSDQPGSVLRRDDLTVRTSRTVWWPGAASRVGIAVASTRAVVRLCTTEYNGADDIGDRLGGTSSAS
ncbi:MAG TPA: hypothetical protein VE733_30260 [Streptosporangiaceae bacterium]|jgi:hypothetical protein|nr:hypothetical protein [Streptosporangiaceae bacterium]